MNNSTSKSTVKPIPITLNCSGGISLGAYMAGVFYEITKEAVQEEPAIIIDTITGASAGAISGIMAAFYLLKRQDVTKDLLQEEKIEENVFYQAWVEKSDLKKIDHYGFKPQKDEITGISNWSVFSGDYIKDIANELLKPEEVKIDENTKPLALIMTITNLQGLLKDFFNAGNIKAVTNAETRQFLFHSGLKNKSSEVEAMWKKVIIGARASGAFPVAFPPVGDDSELDSFNLSGCVDEYSDNIDDCRGKLNNICRIEKDKRTGKDKIKFIFSYTDGGVLDNLPILKGIEIEKRLISYQLFSEQERNLFSQKYINNFEDFQKHWKSLDIDSNSRKYIYIQPQPIENLKGDQSLLKNNFKMFQVATKGLTLPKAEHDAQRLEDIKYINDNDFAEVREKLISESEEKLDLIFENIKSDFEDIKSEIEQKVEEIELKTKIIQKYDEYNLKISDSLKEAKAKFREALPNIEVKLNRIDPSNIRHIKDKDLNIPDLKIIYEELGKKLGEKFEGENDDLLASEFLGGFGGFFDQKYREHDFLLGRISGLTWLHENCDKIQTPIPKDEIVAKIQDKILESEPKLKPSHRVRIIRIVLRGIRILLIESIGIKSVSQIAVSLVAIILIPILMILEILLSLFIYLFEKLEFVWEWWNRENSN
ncbi:MAG: patatin-like phospholipase family protein [Microcoleaceae cyanobacterium MO_207.B10]|nr:patatin-like phospholipase family protein [Microcoleaceae cyanobacterium MO_207.B10]